MHRSGDPRGRRRVVLSHRSSLVELSISRSSSNALVSRRELPLESSGHTWMVLVTNDA